MKRFLLTFLVLAGSLPAAVTLTLDSGGVVPFAFTLADYNSNGVAELVVPSGSTLTVDKSQGGGHYSLYVRAQTANFSLNPDRPGDTYAKPCSDLALKRSTLATYLPLTTSDQIIDVAGAAVTTMNIDYRLRSDLNVEAAGSYSLTLVFTAMQP
jgi:hypothetical protein